MYQFKIKVMKNVIVILFVGLLSLGALAQEKVAKINIVKTKFFMGDLIRFKDKIYFLSITF